MASIMLPVVFMAGPLRPPPRRPLTPAELEAEERGRLRARQEIAAREATLEHTAKKNKMARIELRLPKLKEATKDIINQMHRELLGPEIGKTAYGQKKGIFGSGLWADEHTYMKATRISEETAKERAGIAKKDAKADIEEHNALVDEWNRIATELGYDPAQLRRHITFDGLVDNIVSDHRMRGMLKGL